MATLFRALQSLGLNLPPNFSPAVDILELNVSSLSWRLADASNEMSVHPTLSPQLIS
jgi:hypothetical protein